MAAGFSAEDREALASLPGHAGWEVLRDYLQKQIRADIDALVGIGLDDKSHQAAVLQGRIKSANRTLSVVDAAVRALQTKE